MAAASGAGTSRGGARADRYLSPSLQRGATFDRKNVGLHDVPRSLLSTHGEPAAVRVDFNEQAKLCGQRRR